MSRTYKKDAGIKWARPKVRKLNRRRAEKKARQNMDELPRHRRSDDWDLS